MSKTPREGEGLVEFIQRRRREDAATWMFRPIEPLEGTYPEFTITVFGEKPA